MKVPPQDEAEFLEKYRSCIVATGANIQEVIQAFAGMKKNE